MVTASLTGLIRTIFIIILVYYAIKYLLRLFAPAIIQQVVKKAEQNFYQQQQFNQQQYNNQQQATQNQNQMPKETKKVGEYIDFEEID